MLRHMPQDKATDESLFFKTSGFSMQPFIRDSDRVIAKKSRAQDLRIGDIILYRDEISGKTVCHRFVKKIKTKEEFLIFARGDAAGFSSEQILEGNLIGSVVGIIRDGKVINLRTKRQLMLNWLNAKFYVFLRMAFVFLKKILVFIRLRRRPLRLWQGGCRAGGRCASGANAKQMLRRDVTK